jgi:ABC-type branched-subunit amino acid transport system substrate-binding protein
VVQETREPLPAKVLLPKTSPVVVASKEKKRDTIREREELMKYQEAVRLFREEKRAMEASQMLDAFLAMHPDSDYADDALLEKARIQIFEGESRKAISILKKLLHDFPTSHLRKRTNLELERIYLSEKKWRDCIEAGDNVLFLDPLPDERVEALSMRAVCRFRKRDRMDAVDDAIQANLLSASEEAHLKATQALELIATGLKDRELETVLSQSDGSEPYSLIAIIRLEKDIERGYEAEAMAALMDLLVHYPDQIPDERIQNIYASLRDHLLVQTNTVGAVLPLSGRFAVYGQKALQGIQAALGFLAVPVDTMPPTEFNLVVKDSGADPIQAAQAVRDLSENEQVITIIGPIFSRTTRVAAEAAEESGTPIISLSPDPDIPALGRNVFRRSLLDSQQITALVRLVYDRLQMSRIAFLYPDNPYGRELMNLFWDEIDKRGGEIVAAESFPPGQTDFGPQIRGMVGLNRKMTQEELDLKQAGVDIELQPIVDFDALFIPADFQTVGLLAPQLAFYDVNEVLLVGADGWNSPWLVELGEHYVEGALFTGGFVHDLENPQIRELSEKYWLTFGEDPQALAVQAYDAARIVRTGIESGMVRDRSSLREYLMNLEDFPSVEGLLTTDENGDIRQRPYLLTVVNGKIERFEIEFD